MSGWREGEQTKQVIDLFRCPKCGAKKGEPCTYLLPEGYRPSPRSVSGQRKLRQAGQPMKGTHIERRERFWRTEIQRENQRRLEEAKASQPPWLYALREFDAREHEAMRTWLRHNALRLFRLRVEDLDVHTD